MSTTQDTYVRMGRSGAACRAVKIKASKKDETPPSGSLSQAQAPTVPAPAPPGAQWVLSYATPTIPTFLPSPASRSTPALSLKSSDSASTKSSATAGPIRSFKKRLFGGSKPSKPSTTSKKSTAFNSFPGEEEPRGAVPLVVVAPRDVPLGHEEERLEEFIVETGYRYAGVPAPSEASYTSYALSAYVGVPTFPGPSSIISSTSSTERERQQLLSRLDLFGDARPTYSTPSAFISPQLSSSSRSRQSSATSSNDSFGPKTPPQRLPPSQLHDPRFQPLPGAQGPTLQNHPALIDLVSRCRVRFGVRTVVVAIMRGDQVAFLASEGIPFGVGSVPRVASFCSHAITESGEGLIVLDSQRDPRFTSGLIAPMMGSKFYAGVPLYASSSAPDPTNLKLAIGALCITDDAPRFEFSPSDCLQLLSLAAAATSQIERWVTSNQLASKAQALSLESRYRDWQSSISPALIPPTASRTGSLDPRSSSATPTQASQRSPPLPTPHRSSSFRTPPLCPLPPLPSHRPSHHHLLTAVRSLHQSLPLSLTYLISLDLSTPSPSLTLLASHPTTPTSFSPSLHLQALRAPEGGLLYRRAEGGKGYASGVLIPVLERNGRGWVLCGFTEGEREWGEEELEVFVDVAEGVERGVEGVVLW